MADQTEDGIKLGDRLLYSPYADVDSYTVVQIINKRKMIVQLDKVKEWDNIFAEHGKTISDPNGSTRTIIARKKRSGKKAGELFWIHEGDTVGESSDYVKTDNPYHYRDPSF